MVMGSLRGTSSGILERLGGLFRKCIFRVVSVGPIPRHVAFILDGNRRYARKRNMSEEEGYKAGLLALMSILKYCYELGLQYVSIYAFSIDNFKRQPHEVKIIMDLMREKIQDMLDEKSTLQSYGIRVRFLGDLKLLNDPLRVLAEEAMAATANNTKFELFICVAYTSTNEIVRAVHESCIEKQMEEKDDPDPNPNPVVVSVGDVERHMDTAMSPEVDILVRTSGESRLSNFILWQTTYCYLYSPAVLWPNISFWHLVWAVLNFQRVHPYLENQKKKN